MLAIKSVRLSWILQKLSILTCSILLAGLGESYFPASVDAQHIKSEHLVQAKSDSSFTKSASNIINANTESIIASENAEPQINIQELDPEAIDIEEESTALEEDSEKSTSQDLPESKQDLEQQIIAELNRVRTDPQAYADWLEQQRQHYQGMILSLPGEQSLRTNRGLRTLNEAIAFVRAQQPLPAFSSDKTLLANAQEQVAAILNQQKLDHHANNLVYNRLTPEAIVMQLVVDDGFPDRRHRLAIFQKDYQHTGVNCQQLEIYQQVCAIAYEDRPIETIPDSSTQIATKKPDTSEVSKEHQAANPGDKKTAQTEEYLPSLPNANNHNQEVTQANSPNNQRTPIPEQIVETKPAVIANPPLANLPAPPPAPPEVIRDSQNSNSQASTAESSKTSPATTEDQTVAEPNQVNESEVATNSPSSEAAKSQPTSPATATTSETSNNENEQVSDSSSSVTQTPKTASATKTPEVKPETTEIAKANTVRPTQAAEIIESGVLEEGDDVVPNDGSFYDSFPLEGSAGDSFSISLESQDFDTFLAIMDPEGNIIKKNDDVDENTSNSRLEITLPETGSYNVIVNAYDQGGKGKYTLKVSE